MSNFPEKLFAFWTGGRMSTMALTEVLDLTLDAQEYVRKDLQQNPSGANGLAIISPSLEGVSPEGNEGRPGHRTDYPDTIWAYNPEGKWLGLYAPQKTFGMEDVEYVRKDSQPTDFSTMPKDAITDYLQTSVRYWQDAYQKEKNRVIELEAQIKTLEFINGLPT